MLHHKFALLAFSLITMAASLSNTTSADAQTALPDWAMGPFTRPAEVNPVFKPQPQSVFNCPMRKEPIHWEALHTFNPAAVVKGDTLYVLYRAEDDTGEMHIGKHTSRLGLAQSQDGLHFTRLPEPVFYPAEDSQKENEWDGGCEDPRLMATEDGTFVLTYTQWNRKVARLAVATSKDLVHWQKHGPVFAKAYNSKYADKWSKSGAILGKVNHGQLVAAQINGKYWMYWGEGDVHIASSPDLINWTPLETPDGKLLALLHPRNGKFDSDLAEGGPPAVVTNKGIVVIYNGKNSGARGDKSLDKGAYAGGQALFDAADPTKLLTILDTPFFKPELPFEKTGQYPTGTTFLEGLVLFKKKWFLYYGCADSFVGVAVWDGSRK